MPPQAVRTEDNLLNITIHYFNTQNLRHILGSKGRLSVSLSCTYKMNILFLEGECLLTVAFWAAYAQQTLPEQGRPWPATEMSSQSISPGHTFPSGSPKCQPDGQASHKLNGWEKLTTASWRYKAPHWCHATTWRCKQKRPLSVPVSSQSIRYNGLGFWALLI